MKKSLSILLIASLMLSGCTNATTQASTSPLATAGQTTSGKLAGFTASDIASHTSTSDCWVSLDGNVYDLSAYLTVHPGGVSAIANQCGHDATSAFHSMGGRGRDHSPRATALLKNYYKGVLQS